LQATYIPKETAKMEQREIESDLSFYPGEGSQLENMYYRIACMGAKRTVSGSNEFIYLK